VRGEFIMIRNVVERFLGKIFHNAQVSKEEAKETYYRGKRDLVCRQKRPLVSLAYLRYA